MTDLTAIDILIEPDAAALARATAENARLRAKAPDGFALDESHRPHITLLQRYVRTAELGAVFDVVERTFAAHDPDRLSFRATGLRHMPVAAMPGFGITAIVATPGAGVLELQRALIEAVAPFTGTGGTTAAFETTAQEPEINGDTIIYVERYVHTRRFCDRSQAESCRASGEQGWLKCRRCGLTAVNGWLGENGTQEEDGKVIPNRSARRRRKWGARTRRSARFM